MKQVYIAIILTLLFSAILASLSAYFGYKHAMLHESNNLNEAISKLNSVNNRETLRHMVLELHKGRTEALVNVTGLYKQYATFFLIVSALCCIALYSLYKANVSNKSLNTDGLPPAR